MHDIWVVHYQGHIGLNPISEKGRRWLSDHGFPAPPDLRSAFMPTIWLDDEQFIATEYKMYQDGLSVLEGEDAKGES